MTQNKIIAFKTDAKMQQDIQSYAAKTRRTTSGVIKLAVDRLLLEQPEIVAITQKEEANNDGESGPDISRS